MKIRGAEGDYCEGGVVRDGLVDSVENEKRMAGRTEGHTYGPGDACVVQSGVHS